MKFRRRSLNRLRLLFALVVLVCLAGAVAMFLVEPDTTLMVGGAGAAIAFAGYPLHRDAVVLLASVLLYPILALGVYSLYLVVGIPMEYLLWVSLGVFGFAVLVMTAEEVPY